MIRDLIPATARKVVYTILGFAFALEALFDLIPQGVESRIIAVLALAGFTLAAGNVNA